MKDKSCLSGVGKRRMASGWTGLICLYVSVLSGCVGTDKDAKLVKYREVKQLMGTIVQLDACHKPDEEGPVIPAYEKVWERMTEIHWRMSVFDDQSDVAKVNASFQHPVQIQSDTYRLIEVSLEYHELTKGAFDITVWPLINLWKKAAVSGQVPTESMVRMVRQSIGADHLRLLPENYVEILHPDTMIDLGGIAKGYAVDEAARIFREHGIEQFFIDAGGDVYAGGSNCHGEPWRIGIRDPRDTTRIIDLIELKNRAATTSGNYARFYEIGGKRWSHIINPLTGYPQKGVISATVVASNATQADALSTALCILGADRGIPLIESLGHETAGFIILNRDDKGIEKLKSKMWKK